MFINYHHKQGPHILPILGGWSSIHRDFFVPVTQGFPWNGMDHHNLNIFWPQHMCIYICVYTYIIYMYMHTMCRDSHPGVDKIWICQRIPTNMGLSMNIWSSIYFRIIINIFIYMHKSSYWPVALHQILPQVERHLSPVDQVNREPWTNVMFLAAKIWVDPTSYTLA